MMNQEQFINTIKNTFGNNTIINNALNMLRTNDSKGIEQLARNLCMSNGINPDEAYEKIKKQYTTR